MRLIFFTSPDFMLTDGERPRSNSSERKKKLTQQSRTISEKSEHAPEHVKDFTTCGL